MAKILVSVPVLGKPNLKMIRSLYSAANSCKEHDISLHFSENDSLISRVRNVHLSVFMHDYEEYDYFVSIDSDLEIINKFATNNIFTKLVSHDLKFVGGLYALKSDGESTCASVPMDRNRQPDFDSGLKPMLWLSTGCWCLRRDAIEKMIETYPELTYDGDDNMAGKKVYGLYIPMLKEMQVGDRKVKKYLSEDWSFCQRWKDLGGQIFADTSIALNHYGEKKYPLWKVEVIAKKKVDPPAPVIPRSSADVTEKGNRVPDMITEPVLPPAGFDLGGQ